MNSTPKTKRGAHATAALALALIVLLFVTACSKSTNTGNSSSSTTKPASSMSPTETLKAYYDAARKKDIDAVKKFLSRGTLQVMEDFAKAQGKTLDQMFKENADKDINMPTPEFSNEKVSGDTATVDIKAQGQPMVTMEMVKEDGAWKLAIDKMMNKARTAPQQAGPDTHSNVPDMDNDNDEGNDNDHENGNH